MTNQELCVRFRRFTNAYPVRREQLNNLGSYSQSAFIPVHRRPTILAEIPPVRPKTLGLSRTPVNADDSLLADDLHENFLLETCCLQPGKT
jgi:hypothetical protein